MRTLVVAYSWPERSRGDVLSGEAARRDSSSELVRWANREAREDPENTATDVLLARLTVALEVFNGVALEFRGSVFRQSATSAPSIRESS